MFQPKIVRIIRHGQVDMKVIRGKYLSYKSNWRIYGHRRLLGGCGVDHMFIFSKQSDSQALGCPKILHFL
jgi:hypothetical protein